MRRKIEFSKSFSRKAKKFLIRNPQFKNLYREILTVLSENPFMPSLETHKLNHHRLKPVGSKEPMYGGLESAEADSSFYGAMWKSPSFS